MHPQTPTCFWDRVSLIFAQAVLKLQSSIHVCLPSSWNYKSTHHTWPLIILIICGVLLMVVVLVFELRASCLQSRHYTAGAIPTIHFAVFTLEMGVLQTICPGWPWTVILQISSSHIARITGMGHWCPALLFILMLILCHFGLVAVHAVSQF
jgi:cytochrome bd-type quinol oxidase subunit 1